MKKTLIAIALLIFSLNLKAQERSEPYYGFKLGLTAHPTFGFIKTEKSKGKGEGVSLGFSYGLLGDFNFAENYSFSTGFTITTINGKSTEIDTSPLAYDGPAITSERKYMMQYIEVPLTVKLKTNQIGAVRWYGQFGLSTDFAISRRWDVKQNNVVIAEDSRSNDNTAFFRAGIIAGGGLEYSLDQKTSLMLGLTLNNGFTNLTPDKNLQDGSGTRVRNHYVGLNVAVFF